MSSMNAVSSANGAHNGTTVDGSGIAEESHWGGQIGAAHPVASPPYSESDLTFFRQGLLFAIDPAVQARDKFAETIASLVAARDEETAATQLAHDQRVAALDEAVARTVAELDAGAAEPPLPSDSAAREVDEPDQADALDERLGALREQLYARQGEIATQRREALTTAIDGSLQATFDSSARILDHALQLSRLRQDVAKQNFESSHESIALRAERLEKARTTTQSSLSALEKLRDRLESSGLTPSVSSFLALVGTAGLFVTGWFFSAFASQSSLDNQAYFSFIAGRVIHALDARFAHASSREVLLLAFSVGWILLVALLSLVAWLVHRFAGPQRQRHLVESDEEIVVVDVHVSSFFATWIRFAPVVVAMGLAIILLSFLGPRVGNPALPGTPQDDLDHLLRSLSGEPVGVALCILVTAAFLVYLATVVAPRIREHDALSRGWADHWELVASLASPVVISLATLVWHALVSDDKSPSPAIALGWFLSCLFLTAATLGYGVWAQGIFSTVAAYQERVRQLSVQIEDCHRPKELDRSPIESKGFRDRWQERSERLLALVEGSTDLQGVVVDGGILPFPRRRSSPRLDLDAFDRAYLPDLHARIRDLEGDIREVVARRDELRAPKTRDREAAAARARADTIAAARASLERQRAERSDLIASRLVEADEIRLRYLRRENAFRDGFNLGLWYARVDPPLSTSITAGGVS